MAKTTDSIRDVRKRTTESKSELQSMENKQNNDFLVNYQNQSYNIQKFIRYHPGGTKILRYFKNRSLEKAFEEFPHSQAAFHLLQEFTLNQEKYQKYEVSTTGKFIAICTCMYYLRILYTRHFTL